MSAYKHLVEVGLSAPPIIAVEALLELLHNLVLTVVAWIGVAGIIIVYVSQVIDEIRSRARDR